MTDFSHVVGGDFIMSEGDIALASAAESAVQTLLRRLITNTGAYVWHTDYGLGLPAQVGSTDSTEGLKNTILAQLASESAIDQTQPITVDITTDSLGLVQCVIKYTDAETGVAMNTST